MQRTATTGEEYLCRCRGVPTEEKEKEVEQAEDVEEKQGA